MNKRIHFVPSPLSFHPTPRARRRANFAFTLIEVIGVVAIMAIIAGAIVPNVLKSIDRAGFSSEVTTVKIFGDQVKKYLHDYGALPPDTVPLPPYPVTTPPWVPQWCQDIGAYADINTSDVWTNKRQENRVYLRDPAPGPTPRVLILSSMRAGVSLPGTPPTYPVTATQFDDIWNTIDGQVPPASSWPGPPPAVSGWSNWTGLGEYLIIQRVNLRSEYRTIILQNLSTQSGAPFAPAGRVASYQVVRLRGVAGPIVVVPAAPTATLNPATVTMVPEERLVLYDSTGTAIYTYVVNVGGHTFNFDGNYWSTP